MTAEVSAIATLQAEVTRRNRATFVTDILELARQTILSDGQAAAVLTACGYTAAEQDVRYGVEYLDRIDDPSCFAENIADDEDFLGNLNMAKDAVKMQAQDDLAALTDVLLALHLEVTVEAAALAIITTLVGER